MGSEEADLSICKCISLSEKVAHELIMVADNLTWYYRGCPTTSQAVSGNCNKIQVCAPVASLRCKQI
jgi:hypothetical protein